MVLNEIEPVSAARRDDLRSDHARAASSTSGASDRSLKSNPVAAAQRGQCEALRAMHRPSWRTACPAGRYDEPDERMLFSGSGPSVARVEAARQRPNRCRRRGR